MGIQGPFLLADLAGSCALGLSWAMRRVPLESDGRGGEALVLVTALVGRSGDPGNSAFMVPAAAATAASASWQAKNWGSPGFVVFGFEGRVGVAQGGPLEGGGDGWRRPKGLWAVEGRAGHCEDCALTVAGNALAALGGLCWDCAVTVL